jgi:hypothetical protein
MQQLHQLSKQGRNAPCGCGSGRKFKLCCGDSGPRSEPHASQQQLEMINAWGGKFNGADWTLAVSTLNPEPAVALLVAIEPSVYMGAVLPGRKTGFDLSTVWTDFGPVVVLWTFLYDDPAHPLKIELLLNPACPGGRELLQALSTQEALPLIFHDRDTGVRLGARLHPFCPTLQNVVIESLEIATGYESSPELWKRATEEARRLDPPSAHFDESANGPGPADRPHRTHGCPWPTFTRATS